jgi:glutathione S-transferase
MRLVYRQKRSERKRNSVFKRATCPCVDDDCRRGAGFAAMDGGQRGGCGMYILYGGDFTRSGLVQWVLEEGSLEYEFRKVDIVKGEHKAPEFLAINPAGLVPVLITPGGETLTETAALMVHLADQHGLTELAPAATDPLRGLFLSTIFHLASDIQAEMKRFHFPHRFSPRPEDNLKIQEMAKVLVLSRLAVLNERLARSGPYLLGSRFSLADTFMCFWAAYLDRDAVFSQLRLIGRLYALVKTRPHAAALLGETEQAADDYAELMKQNPRGVIR